MIGSTAAGWLSDRFASRYCSSRTTACAGSSTVRCRLLHGPTQRYLPAFMVFYGLDWLATGAPNIRALAEALGKEDIPIAFGWMGARTNSARVSAPCHRRHPHEYGQLLIDVRLVRRAVHCEGRSHRWRSARANARSANARRVRSQLQPRPASGRPRACRHSPFALVQGNDVSFGIVDHRHRAVRRFRLVGRSRCRGPQLGDRRVRSSTANRIPLLG